MGDRSREAGTIARVRMLTTAEIAWIALVPCAAAAVAAIVVLGPPLGHLLFRPGGDALWPPDWWEAQGRAEPAKQARYVLAILAPLALAGIVVLAARRGPSMAPRAIRALTLAGQLATAGFVALAVIERDSGIDPPRVVDLPALAASAAIVVAALALLSRRRAARALVWLARETTARRVAVASAVVLISALSALQALTTDRLVEDGGQLNWTLNDAFAVLDGRTPLVDYHGLYAKLMPYPAALALAAFGTTALVYSLLMALLSALALTAVYASFRRLARGSLLALGLFIPWLALGEYEHPMRMPALWPMRYGGAYLLAWLTVRHLDGAGPRRRSVLFLVGGLLAIDNLEFGIAALAGTAAALLCAQPRALVRLAGEAVAGVLGAVALVCAFTLLRAGALPDPGLLLEWPRIFSRLGLLSLPMPALGLQLVLYATFAAAAVCAAVRAARGPDDDPPLTGMLAWSGVFGLLAGSYYVGRSEHYKLISLFAAWGFALVPLTVASVRALAARGWRRPGLPELLVLLGFAYAIFSLGQLMAPWKQLERLATPQPSPSYRAMAELFVGRHARRGQTVAILLPESDRIAYDLGLENVSPYGLENAIVTRSQLRTLLDTLRRERVTHVYLPTPGSRLTGEGDTAGEQLDALRAAGYPIGSQDGGFIELARRP
jgi:hypothetical protein